MANAEDIERILSSELERTHKLYKAEAEKFRELTQGVPSRLPLDDSIMRMRQGAEGHNRALGDYSAALKRFNDYAIRRIVPDDLKPRPKMPGGS